MFKINYRILERLDELKSIELMNINERNNIYGFMHLVFNKSEVGLMVETSQLSDEEAIEKEVFLYNDLLCTWFEDLLEVLKNINNNYVVLHEIDVPDRYLEFIKENNTLKIRYLELNESMQKLIVGENNRLKDVQISQINWEEEISIDQFKKEVICKSKEFIKEVLEINSKFENNWRITEIQNLINEIENMRFKDVNYSDSSIYK
jgi:hypothetical protein